MIKVRRPPAFTALPLCLLLSFSACGEPEVAETAATSAKPFDEDAARNEAGANLSPQSFEDVGDTSTCTQDCGGHDAGFEWAKDQAVTDGSECGGNSSSFIEGCEAYAESIEEKVEDERAEAEDGDAEAE